MDPESRFEKRLTKWREGWERVYNVFSDPMSMELVLTKRAAMIAALLGMFVGGSSTLKESRRRFELYKLDKDFGIFTNRRRWDYYLMRYFIYGTKKAISLSFAMGTIVVSTFTITAYRDRYSMLYLPLCAYFVFAFNVFVKGLGVYGLMGSMPAVLIPSALLTVATMGGCYWAGCTTVDDGYRHLRQKFRTELEEKEVKHAQKRRYMLSRNLTFFTPGAKHQMQKEIAEGTWRPTASEGSGDLIKFCANETDDKQEGDEFSDNNNEERLKNATKEMVQQQRRKRQRIQRY